MADQDTKADDDTEDEGQELARDKDLSKRAGVREQLLTLFDEVSQGFSDQATRADDVLDYWDVYNCALTGKQFYNGNSQIFVPIVHNAVNARKTRFTNQIFPQSGRYVEVTSENGDQPFGMMSLLEDYVRKAQLRTKVMPALMRNGDVEGQYTIYVDWAKTRRHVTYKTSTPAELDDGTPNPVGDDVEDVTEDEELVAQHPTVEVIADNDVLVLPHTADGIPEALADGGSVTIIRRWGKGKIRQMMRDKLIRDDAGAALLKRLDADGVKVTSDKTQRLKLDDAGIQGSSGGKYAQVYQTWSIIKVKGERRLCVMYYGGEDQILGCRRNPLWSDKVPVLSVPVEKVAGAFKGVSKVKPVADIQYFANDAINEAADSAAYTLLPIVMTDPNKNPRVGSMIMSLAAVWETSPQDTQFAQFPPLWQHGFEMVAAAKAEVSQTLGVSPAAITSGGGQTSKPSQAEIAQEQQVDILTTADAVTVVEEGILTPLLELFVEMDHQYRDKPLTVRQYGGMGERANMEQVEPIQFDTRYQYRWFGVEQARSAQQVQQQIAGMNVLRGIPPEQLGGYQINLVPLITQFTSNTFGPRLAPLIFIKPEDQMPVPPEHENGMLSSGFAVPTHPMDDDQHHIQVHAQLLQTPDGKKPPEAKKVQDHIWAHMQQMQKKQAAAAAPPQGAPGVPGGAMGGQPQPGVAGTPRIGAQPSGNIGGGQGPPGMIHQDQLHDPSVTPR